MTQNLHYLMEEWEPLIKINLYFQLIPNFFFQGIIIFLPSIFTSTNWKYQVIDINKNMFVPEIIDWHITIFKFTI